MARILVRMTIVLRSMERRSQSERNLNSLKCPLYTEVVGQRLTDPGCRIASATKFCTLASNIFRMIAVFFVRYKQAYRVYMDRAASTR